ncbi:polyprenyl synthetase family protein [Leuconostocaceae bacterium ESL0723]|nr:polyprenyl synthetase family protein [Leuconostocaceae bacterium ESL0723]
MSTTSLPSIWNDFPDIQGDLREVIATINQSWEIGFAEIDQAIRSQLAAGKLVRPALTIMFSQLAQETDADSHQSMIDLAASVELLHLATLIHDDIVDESTLRRGQTSIQTRFGKDTAVYAGDYLLTGMFELISKSNRPNLNGLVITCLQEILHGELAQKQIRYDTETSFADYIDRIKGKTGALFRLSALFGINSGHQPASPELTRVVGQLTEDMGIIFQLLDDYLDFAALGGANQLGKPVGQDIANGIYTAPILFALEDNRVKDQLLAILNQDSPLDNDDLVRVHSLVSESQAMDRLEALMQDYHQELLELVKELPSASLQRELVDLSHLLASRQQ